MSKAKPSLSEILATVPTEATVHILTYAYKYLNEINEQICQFFGRDRSSGKIHHVQASKELRSEWAELKAKRSALERWLYATSQKTSSVKPQINTHRCRECVFWRKIEGAGESYGQCTHRLHRDVLFGRIVQQTKYSYTKACVTHFQPKDI